MWGREMHYQHLTLSMYLDEIQFTENTVNPVDYFNETNDAETCQKAKSSTWKLMMKIMTFKA